MAEANDIKLRQAQEAMKIALGVVGTLAGVSIIVLLLWLTVKFAFVTPEVAGALTDEQRVELLRQTRANDQKLLTTYGWMDPSNQVVRIPIESAMALLVQEYRPASSEQSNDTAGKGPTQ